MSRKHARLRVHLRKAGHFDWFPRETEAKYAGWTWRRKLKCWTGQAKADLKAGYFPVLGSRP